MQEESQYLLDTHIAKGLTNAGRAVLSLAIDALIKSHKEGVRQSSQGWWDDQPALQHGLRPAWEQNRNIHLVGCKRYIRTTGRAGRAPQTYATGYPCA